MADDASSMSDVSNISRLPNPNDCQKSVFPWSHPHSCSIKDFNSKSWCLISWDSREENISLHLLTSSHWKYQNIVELLFPFNSPNLKTWKPLDPLLCHQSPKFALPTTLGPCSLLICFELWWINLISTAPSCSLTTNFQPHYPTNSSDNCR